MYLIIGSTVDAGPDISILYIIWAAILTACALVWLLSLRMSLRAFAPRQSDTRGEAVEVNLEPNQACKEIARRLTAQSFGLSVRILTCTSEEVTARVTLYPGVYSASLLQNDERGASLHCRLVRGLKGTRLSWTIDTLPLNGTMKKAAYALLVLGALALVAGAIIFPLWVIPSNEPAIRWQVLQTLQVMHFQWPPALIAFIARRRSALVEARVSDLLANIAFF
ncbi:MAG: hypothetical protein JXA30_09035 [Deltaproteobacteria bacterium]|nr:hypothetical protein [Deltaproteobacteria bacterium]